MWRKIKGICLDGGLDGGKKEGMLVVMTGLFYRFCLSLFLVFFGVFGYKRSSRAHGWDDWDVVTLVDDESILLRPLFSLLLRRRFVD